MNIGIIIRNDHDHTFPVALTPQMVGVIQNLLTQIPLMNSKLVDGQGKKIATKASIPIIPRKIEFNWEQAYEPLPPGEEEKLMNALKEEYSESETEGISDDGSIAATDGTDKTEDAKDPDSKITQLPQKKDMFTDKDNPFNLELSASGRANVDMEKSGEDTGADKTTDDKKYPDVLADKKKEEKDKDCTVTPISLVLGAKNKL